MLLHHSGKRQVIRRKRTATPKARRALFTRDEVATISKGHIVDRAIGVARLLSTTGLSQVELARAFRLSPGVISRLAGVGAVLARLSDLQVARFRSPLITWKVVQGIPIRGRADTEVLAALGAPLVTGPCDKRTRRSKRPGRGSSPRLVTLDWVRDPSLTGNNPATFIRAYRAYLRELHEAVAQTLRETIAAGQVKDAGIPLAGQSLRELVAATTRRTLPPMSPDAVEARRLFAALDAALRPLVGIR